MKALLAVLLVSLTMCTQKQEIKDSVKADETELNKQIINKVFDELINKSNLAAVEELYNSNVVDHSAWEGQAPGAEGLKKAVEELNGMFSDLKVNIEDIIASGDLVATRETWKGTDVKTKKILTGETMHFFKIKEGKITAEWSKGWDWLPNP